METMKIAYQPIWFDYALADGTYTPAELRKAGLVVQRGKEQAYVLEWPGGVPRPERAEVRVKWNAKQARADRRTGG
jgi:hypothetical protein